MNRFAQAMNSTIVYVKNRREETEETIRKFNEGALPDMPLFSKSKLYADQKDKDEPRP